MASKQSSTGDGEILFAALAAETKRAVRAAGLVSLYGAAGGAHRFAVGIAAQRIILKAVSASASVMRNTCARLRVFAALLRRK